MELDQKDKYVGPSSQHASALARRSLGGTVALSDRAWSARPTRSTYGARRSDLNRANGVTSETRQPVARVQNHLAMAQCNSAFHGPSEDLGQGPGDHLRPRPFGNIVELYPV